jgi:putative MFS transporter
MAATTSAAIAARLDRLPSSRHVWNLVLLLSLGGLFEFYDLFFTAYVAPGLLSSGMFTPASLGAFSVLGLVGAAGFGTFVFATFAGLFVGTIVFGFVADRFGRRVVFTYALVWYSVCTFIMAFQSSGFGIDSWRFIAGIGIGVELVTIDTYIAELIPAGTRGRAYAFNQFVTFCVVPVVALLGWLLVPHKPFGLDGWRWVVLFGSVGALLVWVIRRGIPESPRWLANHGRLDEADAVTSGIEARVLAQLGSLPPVGPHAAEETGEGNFSEIWQPLYRGRTVMLSVFNFFQTIGFYGFAAWVPTLLIAKGIHITTSLEYAFIIAIANPIAPLLGISFADKMERKWQICLAAAGVAVFMVLFGLQDSGVLIIVFGVAVTLCNNVMSYSYHNYQAELYPTRVRARAVGFVYSWSRLSAAFAGLLIGFFLRNGGVIGVALFIAASMAIVIISIGTFGPRTRGLALEDIAQ